VHPSALWIFDGYGDAPKAEKDRVDEQKGIEKNESDHGNSSPKPEKVFHQINIRSFLSFP
jgi:hypothetical protein